MFRFFLFSLLSLFFLKVEAQNMAEKVFFDKNGKFTTETAAYYYRVPMDGQGNYKSFYMNGGALYFEGKIVVPNNEDDNKNKWEGTCKWYYKNGKTKAVRTFNATNQETGLSTYYFENGQLQKEIEFKDGQLVNNRYNEYDESGISRRIFEEEFSNNNNDWDLYKSDKSFAQISKGFFELTSFTKEGTSRYINLPIESSEYTIEADINTALLPEGEKAGIVYGFKDWQNFHYFFISQSSFYVGSMYEGVSSINADGMFCSALNTKAKNNLKILTNGEKIIFSVNGEIQFSKEKSRLFGQNIGIAVSGKSSVTIDRLVVKEIDFKSASNNGSTSTSTDIGVKASGTGLLITKGGYVLTNHHVIENANKIMIEIPSSGNSAAYSAKLINKDKENDLAILKIEDAAFQAPDKIRYSFKETGVEVGSPVFTIGYPFALSGMGKEAKFTDGKVSAKTGYNNAINSFQTSIPVQPGNSGGPVFTEKCQLAGLINASITETDNVSYAIKLNYIRNLIELLPETIETPSDVSIAQLSMEEKIKILSKYVVLIKIK